MRLKSIKLAGFKSFVDATTVPFSTNMTAIVGPNGCGKSNIIDAVRWVMGESSAKNLRGENMTDVIFNGSTGRQPVGQASIELLFDNAEGRLSGEYAAFSEISIKRKVTREGLSQYYLNGTKCRRRDVTDIFLGTGMGPRSYAIIEQGMISKLIESKPEDLRVYLEEAAGISKYKERRRETENRMRRTQDNLDRLADIRDELAKQLQHLKRQASAAERYAEYKKEQRLLNAKLNAMNWRNLNEQAEQKIALEKTFEEQIEDAVVAKNTNENQIDSLRSQIEDAQEQFNSIQGKFYQSGAEIASLEHKIQYEKNRLNEQQQALEVLTREISDINEALTENREKLEQGELELEDILLDIEEAKAKSEIVAEQLELRSRELDQWQAEWEAFNHENAQTRQEAELAQSKIQQHEHRLRELSVRAEKLENEKNTIETQIADVDLDSLKEEALILTEKVDQLSYNLAQLQPKISSKQSELEDLKQRKSELFKKLSEEKAVLASLKTLQSGVLGDQSIKARQWLDKQGFHANARLLDDIQVAEGWEQAVEHVLANWLDAFVMDTNEDSSEFMQSLSSERLSINFLSKNDPPELIADNTVLVDNLPGRPLTDLVTGPGGLNSLLANIFSAHSLEDALSRRLKLNQEQSIVTRDGFWLSKSWMRYYQPAEEQSGMLLRAQKIQVLEQRITESEVLYLELTSDIETANLSLTALEEQTQQTQQQINQVQLDLRKVEQIVSSNQVKLDQFHLRLLRSDEDLTEVLLAKEDALLALEEIRTSWQEAMSQLEIFSERREQLIERKEKHLSELESVRGQARDVQNSVHQKQLHKQQKESLLMLLRQTIQRLALDLSNHQDKVEQLAEADTTDDALIEGLSLQLEGLLETRLSYEQKLNDSRRQLEQAIQCLREEEGKRNTFENTILANREKLSSTRLDLQALKINQRNLLEKIQSDEFHLDEVINSLADEDTEPRIQTTLEDLAGKISRLGSINLAAIEEFKIQSERKEHLDAQNEDLADALETLMAAIRKIDKETRIRFKETYDQVNEGLQKLFPRIFGGGNAYLELTDDNLLETGVQIIARPPGKKNATIHLLSGGEKSLTAIALIFAIFELNPAPFCMLDEVDAPLDDANVGRFANMVKEMSSQVQFIYISHNKVSMERADQLMGVTMHEPGVSRLVSVDIEQAAAMVESA